MVLKGQYIRAERASYNNREYFTLGGCCGTERPKKKKEQARFTKTENISLWEGAVVLKGQKKMSQATITENISLWEGGVVLKGQYIRASYNNREYFTLGG